MGRFNDTGYGTVVLAAETDKSLRVNPDGSLAGIADRDVGITTAHGKAGEEVTVSFANKQGLQKATCDGAIPINAPVYTAADGKISASADAGSILRGIAVDEGVDNEVIGIMPSFGSAAVEP